MDDSSNPNINGKNGLRTSSASDAWRGKSLPASLLTTGSLATIIASPRSSDISLLPKSSPEAGPQKKRVEDRSWSWGYLRKRFKEGKLENLYHRYTLRIHIAYFNSYLLTQLFLSCLFIVLLILSNYNVETGNVDLKEAYAEIIRQLIFVLMSVLIFFYIRDEKKFHKYPFLNLFTSVIVVSILHLSDIAVFVYYYLESESHPVRTLSTLHLLIVLYFLLPIPDKRESALLGILVSFTSVLCKSLLYSSQARNESDSFNWKSLALMDSIYYACVNVIGIHAQFLREINERRAFLDRRQYLKSNIKNKLEKEKEDHLLQSILPHHISEKVKAELLSALQITRLRENALSTSDSDVAPVPYCKSPFSELFVERHNNITILFADIVNFTILAGKLKADELIECLNALYGRFDSAAKRSDCLRIKLLGDCYYCVSSEARNCVELGFDMIEIIKNVRDKYQVNVAMRIGIHTGNILSGLLGIHKWQYDIWSKDVTIANCMESSGKKDTIHVSKAAKDFLGQEYEYEPGNGQERSAYLKENNIETFFVVPNRIAVEINEIDYLKTPMRRNGSPTLSIRTRRDSALSCISNNNEDVHASPIITPLSSRKRPNLSGIHMKSNVQDFLLMLRRVNDHMRDAIDEMPFARANLCCSRKTSENNVSDDLTALCMNFERISLETEFQREDDPLFKNYVSCALFALGCQGLVMLTYTNIQNSLWISYGCGFAFMALLTVALWTPYLWESFKDPKRDNHIIPKPKFVFVKLLYHCSIFVAKSFVLRILLYIFITQLISTIAIIDAISCADEEGISDEIQECSNPWYFTYSCALALLVMYSFLRMHFLLKFVVSVVSLTGYGYVVIDRKSFVFNNEQQTLPGFSPEHSSIYSHMLYLVSIALLLLVSDRQREYICRLDFLWKNRLKAENDEAQLTHDINTILIHNILPLEIANIYLDSSRVGEGYSRGYKNVSVMFATIPKFMDSFSDKDISGNGYFLEILNEIIIEFDQALLDHVDIEKIKVVGSTYMAACGLEVQGSGRLSSASGTNSSQGDSNFNIMGVTEGSENGLNIVKRRRTLITLVQFAASMMARLDQVNKDAFQNFELRVGITCGSLVAGVIGAEKPMYDIWGDVVNMASRMDSTGVQGKIQVNEESANILMQAGVKCECRGEIQVKGKGMVKTYFVALTSDHNIITS